ncbi:MAG: pyridoxine 5'-phosphate synthase [Pseudomonadota bacterium]
MKAVRLGVNIDHVATVRNARGGVHPDPIRAAMIAQKSGADGITAHLREDRRHISDDDIAKLMKAIDLPLNLEMAATEEMLNIALHHKPHAICLVPEKREEKTTEGGLDLVKNISYLQDFTSKIDPKQSRLSLFIDPEITQIDAAVSLRAPVIELHTGAYCEACLSKDKELIHQEKEKLYIAAKYAHQKNIEVHAGHGITFDTVSAMATLPHIAELNIGHFIIGEAIFCGLENAILKMRDMMNRAQYDFK